MKYLSKIFQPTVLRPKNSTIKNNDVISKSQRLMMELGITRPTSGTGLFVYLPFGMRFIEKLTNLIQNKLSKIGAQRFSLPTLASEDLWAKSGRLDTGGSELMKLSDRHERKFILSPTHEELVTDLIASVSPISEKDLPLRIYQISSKFRDEMRPRYGVIRSREFLMKDLYTFDVNLKSASHTYNLINEIYEDIFSTIGIEYVKVEGDTGTIGGTLSHEYHYPASIGDDELLECTSCKHKVAQQLLHIDSSKCIKCGHIGLKKIMGIEVGHTFLLGTKYSDPLGAHSVNHGPLHMGCYGLGVSRVLGAAIEVLSTDTELRWPAPLAPYTLCIIGPKEGSKEENTAGPLVEKLYERLNKNVLLNGDILIDDRLNMTIGKRVLASKRMGFPFIIVVGQKAATNDPLYEILDINNNEVSFLNEEGLVQKLNDYLENNTNNSLTDVKSAINQ